MNKNQQTIPIKDYIPRDDLKEIEFPFSRSSFLVISRGKLLRQALKCKISGKPGKEMSDV